MPTLKVGKWERERRREFIPPLVSYRRKFLHASNWLVARQKYMLISWIVSESTIKMTLNLPEGNEVPTRALGLCMAPLHKTCGPTRQQFTYTAGYINDSSRSQHALWIHLTFCPLTLYTLPSNLTRFFASLFGYISEKRKANILHIYTYISFIFMIAYSFIIFCYSFLFSSPGRPYFAFCFFFFSPRINACFTNQIRSLTRKYFASKQ